MTFSYPSKINDIDWPSPILSVDKLDGYASENYLVKLQKGVNTLVKYYPLSDRKLINEEIRIINEISSSISILLPSSYGHQHTFDCDKNEFVRLLNFMPGKPLQKSDFSNELMIELGTAAAKLNLALDSIDSDIIKANQHRWNLRDAFINFDDIKHIKSPSDRKIVDHYMSRFENECIPAFRHLNHSIIHGDLNEANIIIENAKLSGFIDFGDISYAPTVCELAILMTYMMMLDDTQMMSTAELLVKSYHQIKPLTPAEIELLPLLIATRLCVSVINSAKSKAESTSSDYILISENQAWSLLHQWTSINPILLKNRWLSVTGYKYENPDLATALARRHRVASPSLSLSYDEPIQMSRALFQYMYDAEGNTYLDAYNNIPHIGHCHPAVVEATRKQSAILNTNTRYLYDIYADYSETILSLFPDSLDKAMLVNSGSEASDLATRIATTVTGHKGIAVMEWGYHGNTQNGINISSYKFDRKGGKGAQDWILKLPLPKAYQGRHLTAESFVNESILIIEEYEASYGPLAAFITEPISGCGGQVPLFPGYLSLMTDYLKAKGTLVIIDEVQTGFGRLGHWFWGFEMHGIEPDLVILGKPIANGHPMGGVVTRSDITQAFKNGMEFFSSFGGNPVSCAIGKAVINTIREEELQANAKDTGTYWMDKMRKLQGTYSIIGDVRGEGLFIGVELVNEDGSENTSAAQLIKNELKRAFVLASTDGPLDNVLKMKPPLCINKNNVDHFVDKLEVILSKM